MWVPIAIIAYLSIGCFFLGIMSTVLKDERDSLRFKFALSLLAITLYPVIILAVICLPAEKVRHVCNLREIRRANRSHDNLAKLKR